MNDINILDTITDAEAKDYIESNNADDYLSSLEFHCIESAQ